MLTVVLDYFFPRLGQSAGGKRSPEWKRLMIGLYVSIGLFAFGHNYANYPVMDKSWRDEEPPELNQFLTGLKAGCAGIGWPAYSMILINERLK